MFQEVAGARKREGQTNGTMVSVSTRHILFATTEPSGLLVHAALELTKGSVGRETNPLFSTELKPHRLPHPPSLDLARAGDCPWCYRTTVIDAIHVTAQGATATLSQREATSR